MNRTVLIMAGGTGGHVFPALAVANELLAKGVHIHWLGSQGGFEEKVVTAAGIPLTAISVRGLRGKGLLSWMLAPARMLWAFAQALAVFLRLRPDVVLGMGGFVAGPGGFTAWLLRRPLLIHEQNARPGLTNRLLAPLADQVLVAFPGVLGERKSLPVGNPVRREMLALADPESRFAGRIGAVRILIVGGSLGAQVLNETLPEILADYQRSGQCRIRHQVGKGRAVTVKEKYQALAVEAEVSDFIEDMAAAYAWADLIICRAGALTVSEIMVVGLAAILVPYPFAVDDHQRYNAEPLLAEKAALMVMQGDDFGSALAQAVTALIASDEVPRQRLLTMAQAARRLGRPAAAEQLAEYCLEVADA